MIDIIAPSELPAEIEQQRILHAVGEGEFAPTALILAMTAFDSKLLVINGENPSVPSGDIPSDKTLQLSAAEILQQQTGVEVCPDRATMLVGIMCIGSGAEGFRRGRLLVTIHAPFEQDRPPRNMGQGIAPTRLTTPDRFLTDRIGPGGLGRTSNEDRLLKEALSIIESPTRQW